MRAARYALLLSAIYAAAAGAYIWLSGAIAARVASDVHDLARLERLKGLLFVATTATLLFLAAYCLFRRMIRMIKERERMRQAVIVAQSRVIAGEMAAAVAHDFNNALMVVKHALAASAEAHATGGADLGEVTQAMDYATDLARQLIKTARGERRLHPERRDLARVARSTVRSISRIPRLLRVRFDLDIAAEVIAVVDVMLFEQILTNLLLNAGDVAGAVRIVLQSAPDQVRLEVHDNGPGIPEQQREKVFNAFESTKPEGLGLGLLSVRAAVEIQGGTVTVTTSPLGGAAFIVSLPKAPASPPSSGPAPPA